MASLIESQFIGSASKVNVDVKDLLKAGKSFEKIQKQVKFAQALAVNDLILKLRDEHRNLMRRVFDRPTVFTIKGLDYKKANRKDQTPEAYLFFKTEAPKGVPAGKYLQAQVFGGARVKKSTERRLMLLPKANRVGTFTVPRRSERDQYGNMRGGRYTKILSQLKISNDAFQNVTDSERSKKKRRAESFFILQTTKGYNAIFSRTSKKTIKPILYLKFNSPNYQKRYPYFEFSEQYWNKNIVKYFDNAWAYTLSTAKW